VIPHLISDKEIQKYKDYIKNAKILHMKEEILNSETIKHRLNTILSPSYEFHDYIFLLKKSQIHTCHRDYNGDFFNERQKFPSYTMIIYLEPMEKCLEIIPTSHESFYNNAINITDNTETVVCKPGDALLFNGNLIHTGSINKNENNMRIQLKISHIEDHETLGFYQNYHKILDKTNTHPKWIKYMQKHISCQFPIVSAYSQKYDFNVVSENKNNTFLKSLYSNIMYGDSTFYELNTATR